MYPLILMHAPEPHHTVTYHLLNIVGFGTYRAGS